MQEFDKCYRNILLKRFRKNNVKKQGERCEIYRRKLVDAAGSAGTITDDSL